LDLTREFCAVFEEKSCKWLMEWRLWVCFFAVELSDPALSLYNKGKAVDE
jgi:hypothetical protein